MKSIIISSMILLLNAAPIPTMNDQHTFNNAVQESGHVLGLEKRVYPLGSPERQVMDSNNLLCYYALVKGNTLDTDL